MAQITSGHPNHSLSKQQHNLVLYVADNSPRNQELEVQLRTACEQYLPGRFSLRTVNLVEARRATGNAPILATPTLVIENAGVTRRYVGRLIDCDGDFRIQRIIAEENR